MMMMMIMIMISSFFFSESGAKDGELLESPISDLLSSLTDMSMSSLVKEKDGHASINVPVLEKLVMSTEVHTFYIILMTESRNSNIISRSCKSRR